MKYSTNENVIKLFKSVSSCETHYTVRCAKLLQEVR